MKIIKECGDRQCLLKISDEETKQLISQRLHTNLPERTVSTGLDQGFEQRLVGPLPSMKICLLSRELRERIESNGSLQKILEENDSQSSLVEGLWWVNDLNYEVTPNIISDREVSVIREPAFIPTELVDLVESVECVGAQCILTRQGIELFSVNPKRSQLKLRARLKRGAKVIGGGSDHRKLVVNIPLRRCSIASPSVPILGDIRQHKVLLAISRGCGAGKVKSIKVNTWPPTRSFLRREIMLEDQTWRYFELLIQDTPSQGEELKIALIKEGRQEILLGEVEIPLEHDYHPKQVRLSIPRLGQVDFIPSNQNAELMLAYEKAEWISALIPKSMLSFYQITQTDKRPLSSQHTPKSHKTINTRRYQIRADLGASGILPILLSYQPQLKEPFERFNQEDFELATFRTENRYALRKVNLPLRLTSSRRGEGVVEVSCITQNSRLYVTAKSVALIPYESRHSCRVIIYRERIPREIGELHILVTEDSEKFRQVVTASHGVGEIVISIPVKKAKEFDRLEIGVGHNYSSAQYDFAPQQDLGAESRYEVVLGDRTFGLSLSTSLPTGLFRYGFSAEDRSSVALSAGGLGRLLWLWREGRPFPVGLDFGALVTGIDGEPHLSLIGGIGVSVPVLNANTPFEASFNLHAWLEYAPTRYQVGHSPWSLLFGPSFAVGKFSTNL